MNKVAENKMKSLALAIVTVLTAWHVEAVAQDGDDSTVAPPMIADTEEMEEVVVTGRFISSSQELVNERMMDAFATDLLGKDTIARLGDSTVGAALRRVPGLTLVQDKFVYIRGLGERYSQATLNGATIPSPDLTRNVIPLDIFPTSIIEALKVQKSYTPELSANFGGGAVDIRTRAIPDQFNLKFEVGLGSNTENPSTINTYAGGGDDNLGTDDGARALPTAVSQGVSDYQGRLNPFNILSILQRDNPAASLYDAESINRDLFLNFNRDYTLQQTSPDIDYKLRGTVGNNFLVRSDWELGFEASASYETDTRWRRSNVVTRLTDPDNFNGTREEATKNVSLAGTLTLGARWGEDHSIQTTSLYLRNTDDETEVFDFFNENAERDSGTGRRQVRYEFEERDMTTNQIRGEHYLGAFTRERIPLLGKLFGFVPEEAKVDWFYSKSDAATNIPNRFIVGYQTTNTPVSGEVLTATVLEQTSAANLRFTDLDDEVENYGWSGLVPLDFGNNYVEFSGGYDHRQKARTYRQDGFTFGYLTATGDLLTRPLGEVFSDGAILADMRDPDPTNPDPDARVFENNFRLQEDSDAASYLAATMTDSVFGKVDWTWKDTWRVAAGARWEDYRQVAVPWNPIAFGTTQIPTDPDELAVGTFNEDEIYPAVGLTYIGDLWAETFQVRLGFSQTTIRPDLREITAASYIDPLTDARVDGNPLIRPSELDNLDLRAEWFFENGDNLTFTIFNKDIKNPIEFFESAGSDTVVARRLENAVEGSTTGVEVEFLKELSFLGGWGDMFFFQGNFTVQDTELDASNIGDSTNPIRPLSGASDYMVNFMLGFDSRDTKHTASLSFNTFGERLFSAGRNGSPDAYEQPFNSLDLTYFWYPTDRITTKFKFQNLLNESVTVKQGNVTTFEEETGLSYQVTLSWVF